PINRKDDVEKMAESNRAFGHYRWCRPPSGGPGTGGTPAPRPTRPPSGRLASLGVRTPAPATTGARPHKAWLDPLLTERSKERERREGNGSGTEGDSGQGRPGHPGGSPRAHSQHRDHGAHRRRDDDDDGGDPLLHGSH